MGSGSPGLCGKMLPERGLVRQQQFFKTHTAIQINLNGRVLDWPEKVSDEQHQD
jgi:hypothetical protein